MHKVKMWERTGGYRVKGAQSKQARRMASDRIPRVSRGGQVIPGGQRGVI